MKQNIQIISAPSILGLKPGGVQHLGSALLAAGLADKLKSTNGIINVPTKNDRYSFERDKQTGCLNPIQLRDFSLTLMNEILQQVNRESFQLVLGGDCSILLGIMPALKTKGNFGLIFLDAHADFYEPSKSPTGEVADMDLAIITGRGPGILTNIGGLIPYVEDENVIHIGQRDAEETRKYNSQDIRDSSITCFDLECIQLKGLDKIIAEIVEIIKVSKLSGYWIHFDTDVLNDKENPAVDYRLPGGLTITEAKHLLSSLIATGRIAGMSVTIFNPDLDTENKIAQKICGCVAEAFS